MFAKSWSRFQRGLVNLRGSLYSSCSARIDALTAYISRNLLEDKSGVQGRNEEMKASIILRGADLRITGSRSSLSMDIDIRADNFLSILPAACAAAAGRNEQIVVYSDHKWIDITHSRMRNWMSRPHNAEFVELAIVRDMTIIERYSVNLWRQFPGFLESISTNSVVKRISNLDIPELDEKTRIDYPVFPIDVVYTWVNDKDKRWRDLFSSYRNLSDVDSDRFEQGDELRYSLRSIEMYAPWVRNIYIFSNCEKPDWFIATNKVKWVDHIEVIPSTYLPLFNSHAIESFIHDIPGLSEQFIYFNDDFFLTGFVRPIDFFTAYGQSVARLEPYGIVEYLRQLRDGGNAEEWQCAAVNGAELMLGEHGMLPTKLHRHAPYALLKSVMSGLISTFPKQAHDTRSARFRKRTDVSFVSFLYHNYALYKRAAVESNEDSMILRPTNYRRFRSRRLHRSLRFFCLNDGGGSSKNPEYMAFKGSFLSTHYPFKSRAEK